MTAEESNGLDGPGLRTNRPRAEDPDTSPAWSQPRRGISYALPLLIGALFVVGGALDGAVVAASAPAHESQTPLSGAVPAQSCPCISLNRTSGTSLVSIDVTLSGFAYDSNDGEAMVNLSNASVPDFVISSDPFYYIDSSGGASFDFTPPPSATPGTYEFTAFEAGVGSVSTTYTLTAGATTLTATRSTCGPGNAFTVTGTGFPLGYPYTLYIGPAPTMPYQELFYGSSPGSPPIDTCVSLPSQPVGSYVLFASDLFGGYYAATNVPDQPILPLVVTPSQGLVGTDVSVSGTGLIPAGATVNVYDGSGTLCSATLNPHLQYSCSFTVGSIPPGTYTLTATDGVGAVASGTFAVTVPALSLSPDQGPVGATVTIIGHGFTVHSTLAALTFGGLDFFSGECLSGSFTTGVGSLSPGEFSCTILVPPLADGAQSVVATDTTGIPASATFTVTSPSLAFSPAQGPDGATVTLMGHGFSVDTTVASVSFDGVAITSCLSGSLTTGTIAPGGFSCTFDVPAVTPGVVSVTATDVTGAVGLVKFSVTTPSLTLSANQGPDDARITVIGHGFSVDTPIASLVVGEYTWTSSYCLVGSLTTGTSGLAPGEFSCTLRFTGLSPGTIYVNATDVTGLVGSAKFTVTNPTLIVTPASGPVGSTITVIGHGFSVDAPIRYLNFDVTNITTCSSGSLTTGGPGLAPGEFSCSFTVPSEFITSISIDAVDWGYSTGVTTFTIT